jgi:hypothetical protein
MHNIVPDSPRCLDGEGAIMQFVLLKQTGNDSYDKVVSMTSATIGTIPVELSPEDYSANDTFVIKVMFNWRNVPKEARDFTVMVYSKHRKLTLTDMDGQQNMLHMDQPNPQMIAPDFIREPTSLWDLILQKFSSPAELVTKIQKNIWVLWTWWDEY